MIREYLNKRSINKVSKFLDNNMDILFRTIMRVEHEREFSYIADYPKKNFAYDLLVDKLKGLGYKITDIHRDMLMDKIEDAHIAKTQDVDSNYNGPKPPNVY